MRFSNLVLSTLVCIGTCGFAPSAQAGPLLDWLFGRRAAGPTYAVGGPVPMGNGPQYGAGYAGYPVSSYGNYYSSRLPVYGNGAAGYLPPTPSANVAPTLPPTLPPTLSYVPAYRTNSYRAPVTYYRPLLTTDPNTGAQVVTQAPCTSYEYQTQRVPILGSRELYGSTVAPRFQPTPQALPTYTIPSGGIPLAAAQPSTAYRGYAPAIPQSSAPGTYPTTPLNDYRSGYGAYNQSQYYDSAPASGGSTGSYVPPSNYPTPGLTAPQAPPASTPGRIITPAPTYGQPVPGPNGPAGPATNQPLLPNNDPADSAPVLPSTPTGAISRYQGMRRIPTPNSQSAVSQSENSVKQPTDSKSNPFMNPIPAPDNFELPRGYNPGLLREGDMTAMQPVQAGQSAAIHWASFEEPETEGRLNRPNVVSAQSLDTGSSSLRPIARMQNGSPQRIVSKLNQERIEQRELQNRVKQQPVVDLQVRPPTPVRRYDTSGWQTAK